MNSSLRSNMLGKVFKYFIYFWGEGARAHVAQTVVNLEHNPGFFEQGLHHTDQDHSKLTMQTSNNGWNLSVLFSHHP